MTFGDHRGSCHHSPWSFVSFFQGEKGEGWTTTELLPDGNFSFQEVEEAIDILGAHGSEIGESMQEVLAISEGRSVLPSQCTTPSVPRGCSNSTD